MQQPFALVTWSADVLPTPPVNLIDDPHLQMDIGRHSRASWYLRKSITYYVGREMGERNWCIHYAQGCNKSINKN